MSLNMSDVRQATSADQPGIVSAMTLAFAQIRPVAGFTPIRSST